MGKIEILDVSYTFDGGKRGKVHALQGVNLKIEEGELISLLGPSGCGKSTLLYMIASFYPAQEGHILLDGKPVTRPGPDRGIVFQEYVLFPWRTVEENVTYGLEMQGRGRQEREREASRFLEKVGLSGFKKKYPHELSGGMKQRVALARMLAYNPEILLMDEPFGALDAQTRELMQDELLGLWQELRKTVIFVTHDIEEALYLSDRIVVFTARPGMVKEVLKVNLPRPRDRQTRLEREFAVGRDYLWSLLKEEITKAKLMES
jgi:NitT/TauT family transport system ATP-binding protein